MASSWWKSYEFLGWCWRRRLELEPLIEKPPDPKKYSKKKKEQTFNIRELVYLNYCIHWNFSEELRECEHFLFKVDKDFSEGLVEVYNVEIWHLIRMDRNIWGIRKVILVSQCRSLVLDDKNFWKSSYWLITKRASWEATQVFVFHYFVLLLFGFGNHYFSFLFGFDFVSLGLIFVILGCYFYFLIIF